jgi:hypothetical protein
LLYYLFPFAVALAVLGVRELRLSVRPNEEQQPEKIDVLAPIESEFETMEKRPAPARVAEDQPR